ncbi:TetR/AcrR family transcriptional regulator [Herbaspirillum sp. NPDC087042]|uniref:TetR/AcrR family transcriptional regulator n=1 Tax=Herbaspirillum sp. NPDC087042 TaxID=3364004 RepID=UPI00381058E2
MTTATTATTTTTSEKILQCAQTLIVAGGYNGFSYADIAKVVGIRNASIHHHFPSKAQLVQTLVQQYRAAAQNGIAEMERNIADPVRKLQAYAGYWEGCLVNPDSSFCVCAMLAAEMPLLPEEIAVEVRAHFMMFANWLTSVLEDGSKQGRIRLTQAPRREAELILATVHGAMLSARAYGDAKMFAVIIRPVLDRLAA